MSPRTSATRAARLGAPLLASALTLTLTLSLSVPARAEGVRARFEPADLKLQPIGTAELDLQAGVVGGENGRRIFAPDFELSIGISSRAQLEIDGTFGVDKNGRAVGLDNTLIGMRIGILDLPDADDPKSAWSAGVQAGPRLPTMPGARSLGLDALAIIGRSAGRMHLFGQVGMMVDSTQRDDNGSHRPVGVELGASLDLDLDDHDRWSLKADVGAVKWLSDDLDQLHLTAGPAINVIPSLELSIVGVVGPLKGGDNLGGLFGATSRFKAF